MNQVEALERAILEHAQEMARESQKSAEIARRNILRESSERLHLREEKEQREVHGASADDSQEVAGKAG